MAAPGRDAARERQPKDKGELRPPRPWADAPRQLATRTAKGGAGGARPGAAQGRSGLRWLAGPPLGSSGRIPGTRTWAARLADACRAAQTHPRNAPANCHTSYGSLRTAYLARGDWGIRPRPLDPRCERKAKRHLLFSHIIGGTAAPPSSPACPLLHTPLAAQQGKAGGASPSWAAAAYRSTTQTSRDRPYLRATYIRCRPLE